MSTCVFRIFYRGVRIKEIGSKFSLLCLKTFFGKVQPIQSFPYKTKCQAEFYQLVMVSAIILPSKTSGRSLCKMLTRRSI